MKCAECPYEAGCPECPHKNVLLWKEIERQSKIPSPLTPPLEVTCPITPETTPASSKKEWPKGTWVREAADTLTKNSRPRYSGPNRTGVCVCGHSWKVHHLGVVMRREYVEQTNESYIPQECEFYGFNEVGGLMLEKGEWVEHCSGYKDSGESG